MEIESQPITFKCSDGVDMVAHLSIPTHSGSMPAIIVLHEAWGLNEQIKSVAARFAENEFVAIAPHLFTRHADLLTEENIQRAMKAMFLVPLEKRNDPDTISNLMNNIPETERKVMDFFFSKREAFEKVMVEDIISCAHHVQNFEFVKRDRLGVTGFCLGGGLAYQTSTMFPFNATVAFYGANPKPLETVANISGPVFGIYAGDDERVNSGVPVLVENMIKYKKDLQIIIYKGCQHAFFNEQRPSYNNQAAIDSWQKTIEFFNKHLKK